MSDWTLAFIGGEHDGCLHERHAPLDVGDLWFGHGLFAPDAEKYVYAVTGVCRRQRVIFLRHEVVG